MDVPTQLELCLHDQLDIVSLLLVSLLFIAIPTPFLNFIIFINFYMCVCVKTNSFYKVTSLLRSFTE